MNNKNAEVVHFIRLHFVHQDAARYLSVRVSPEIWIGPLVSQAVVLAWHFEL